MLTITPPLQPTPQRIVSLVPSLTEALFPFGLGSHLIGSTHYGVEPGLQVQTTTSIGGTTAITAIRECHSTKWSG
jgi:ABC-type hemin transport system substrate-binding protein